VSVVGSESGMDARRVDADSSGARDGTARLSVRPLRGVELRLSEEALRSAEFGEVAAITPCLAVGTRMSRCDKCRCRRAGV
jgi:hypothetical protein